MFSSVDAKLDAAYASGLYKKLVLYGTPFFTVDYQYLLKSPPLTSCEKAFPGGLTVVDTLISPRFSDVLGWNCSASLCIYGNPCSSQSPVSRGEVPSLISFRLTSNVCLTQLTTQRLCSLIFSAHEL